MWDRTFRHLGETLADDQRRRVLIGRLGRWLKRFVLVISLLCLGMLLSVVLVHRWVGENNVTVAAMLYLPRQGWLILPALLFPLALLIHRPSAALLLAGSGLFVLFGMGYRLAGSPVAPSATAIPDELTILTYNRGQHMNQSLQPFKEATLPDLIAFQEAAGRAKRYLGAEGYEDLPHVADTGEFTLLSKFPILSAQRLDIEVDGTVQRPAARFEIDFAGQPVAVYSVHVASPRGTLLSYRGGAFFYGVVGYFGTPWEEHRLAHQRYWDGRITTTRKILDLIDQEQIPTLVIGDFNAPSGGYIHGAVVERLGDAHREVGQGFGFTFPGKTSNPLSLGGPWIRIDYIFYPRSNWEPLWCLTEPDRTSQHRAVAARFRLIAPSEDDKGATD